MLVPRAVPFFHRDFARMTFWHTDCIPKARPVWTLA
jgi:hypothetical protein